MYDNIVYIGGELEDGKDGNSSPHLFEINVQEIFDRLNILDPAYKTVIYSQRQKLLKLYKEKTKDMVYLVLFYGSLPKPPNINERYWETNFSDISWELLHDIANTIPISIVSTVVNAQDQYFELCDKHDTKPSIQKFYHYHNNLKFVRQFAFKDSKPHIDLNCNKLFICMNGMAKIHRAMLVGKLSQADLLQHAHWSWLDQNGKGKELPRIHSFDPSQIVTMQNDILITRNRQDGEKVITPEWPYFGKVYHDAYIDVSVESYGQLEAINYTEKTWKSYMFGKPGLQLAPAGHYKQLWDWGFQPYDELFDYTNLDHPNLSTRINAIVTNLQRLSSKSKQEMNNLINTIEHKLIHNHKTLRTLPDPMPTTDLQHLYDHNVIPNDLLFGTPHMKYFGVKI